MIYMFLFDPKVQGQIIFSLNILKEKKHDLLHITLKKLV